MPLLNNYSVVELEIGMVGTDEQNRTETKIKIAHTYACAHTLSHTQIHTTSG